MSIPQLVRTLLLADVWVVPHFRLLWSRLLCGQSCLSLFVGICFYFSWVNKCLEPWNCQLTGLTAHSLRGSPQRGWAALVTGQRCASCCCPTPGHTGRWSLLRRSARGVLSSEVGVERESLSVAWGRPVWRERAGSPTGAQGGLTTGSMGVGRHGWGPGVL